MNDFKLDVIDNCIYFTGDITENSSHEFILALSNLASNISNKVNKSINLYIASYGGRTTAGIRIYEALKMFPGEVVCYCEGHVASAATTVICGADKVISTPLTTFLIHELSAGFDGKHTNNKAVVEWHETLMQYSKDIYSKKSKGKITPEIIKVETYLTAEQAKELGLVDEIINYVK